MLSKLLRLFGRKPAIVKGAGKLPEGQSRVISLGDPLAGGTEIVLARVDGKLCALDRKCPHENGHLVGGPLVEGRYALCPLHNFKFDPQSGRSVGIECRPAKSYRVREVDGDAEVDV